MWPRLGEGLRDCAPEHVLWQSAASGRQTAECLARQPFSREKVLDFRESCWKKDMTNFNILNG
jgi:hypothetical protein